MAPNPASFIDWRNSVPRSIIIGDLEDGVLDHDAPSAEDAWEELYKNLAEFSEVPFEQFNEQLAAHREQHRIRVNRSGLEEAAFQRDRLLHPRSQRNNRGELVFDMHLSQFQASRAEYLMFRPDKFKGRIYQEIQHKKFLYYMELKREETKRKKGGGGESSQ